MGLSTCYLTCVPSGTLMPLPTGPTLISREVQHLNRRLIQMTQTEEKYHSMYNHCKLRFLELLDKKLTHSVVNENGQKLIISLKIGDKSEFKLNFDTDESYELEISGHQDEMQAKIVAANYFGARHAFETLLNLMVVDELTNYLVVIGIVVVNN